MTTNLFKSMLRIVGGVFGGVLTLFVIGMVIGRMIGPTPTIDGNDPAVQERARVVNVGKTKSEDEELELLGATIFVEHQVKNRYPALAMDFQMIAINESNNYVANPGWAPKNGLVFKVTGTAHYENIEGQSKTSFVDAIVTTDFKVWSLHALEIDGELVE